MKATLPGLVALSATLAPGIANAIGFGEIALQSRVGEPLRAEVRILSGASDNIEPTCFSLVPVRGAELPVITNAKTRLIRRDRDLFLQIVGTSPIAEPAFMVSIRAGCGADLERNFVLMPEAPLMLADAPPAPRVTPARSTATQRSRGNSWSAEDGETLESIAESRAPDNPAEQRRLLAVLKQANPDLMPDTPLLAGTVVQIPDSKPPRAAKRPSENSPVPPLQQAARRSAPPRDKATQAPPPAEPKPAIAGLGKDRLLLGAAPGDSPLAANQTGTTPMTLSETVDRIHKLENTLSLLQQQMEKMDAALALATETIALQEKLESARAQQLAKMASPPLPPPVQAPESNHRGWIELLLSALIGGGLSVGIAQFLTRRQSARLSTPSIATASALAATPTALQPAAELPTAIEPNTADFSEASFDTSKAQAIDVNFDDDTSLLQLAEIMVSFGRIQGAAETLATHIDQTSPNNFLPWSMLLDLYHRSRMRDEFEILAAKMRGKFNVKIPEWGKANLPLSGLKSLEDYAHAIANIEQCWGTPACMSYLCSLVQDTRAGQRNGFPLEVLEEIALLLQVLENGYGLKRPV